MFCFTCGLYIINKSEGGEGGKKQERWEERGREKRREGEERSERTQREAFCKEKQDKHEGEKETIE